MKKKAFTLTELLVVVVIIGVLAAVVLPKFTQVLETRRTTEAEEIMRAVRSEQEARCTLDKNYTANRAELSSFPANEGNNYYYSFTATGIAAVSRNKDYTLRIQSYRDGEICYDGDDCAHLGKTYPVCPARVVAVDECAAETACNLRSYSEACPSGQEGQVLFVPNADCTGYEQVNQCHDITVDPTTCIPTDSRGDNFIESCGEGYDGEKTHTWNTTTCKYDLTDTCVKQEEPQPCAPTHGGQTTYTEPCDEGYDGEITYTWDSTNCKYNEVKDCTKKTCKPTNGGQATYTEPCPEKDGFKLQAGSVYYTWDDQACNYAKDDRCNYTDCSNPPQGKVYYLSDCPSPQVGSGTIFTWDEAACEYKKTDYYCTNGNGNDEHERTWTEHAYTPYSWENTFYVNGSADACASALYQMLNNIQVSNGGGLPAPNSLCSQKGFQSGAACNHSGGVACVQSYSLQCVGPANISLIDCTSGSYNAGNVAMTAGSWHCWGKPETYLSCD